MLSAMALQCSRSRVVRVAAVLGECLALGVLTAACGGASSSTTTATRSATPLIASSSKGGEGATQQELIAVANHVYPADGSGTCQGGNPLSPMPSDVVSCPFTARLAERVVAAQESQAKLTTGSIFVVCHCQNGAKGYNARVTNATESGGTVTVIAAYCCGDNLTFTLTIITQQGKLLVNDITVQGAACTQAVEIDATSC